MTFFELDAVKADCMRAVPPIGRPMDNVVVYLLAGDGSLAPAGAPGHLHLGAPHAARGYLGFAPERASKYVYETQKGKKIQTDMEKDIHR